MNHPGDLVESAVDELPPCDMCKLRGRTATAAYDARIPLYGSWANVCKSCFLRLECSLGTGKGQRLVLRAPVSGRPTRAGDEPSRKRWACRPPEAPKRVFNRQRDAFAYAERKAPEGSDPESFVWREVLGGDGHWRRG